MVTGHHALGGRRLTGANPWNAQGRGLGVVLLMWTTRVAQRRVSRGSIGRSNSLNRRGFWKTTLRPILDPARVRTWRLWALYSGTREEIRSYMAAGFAGRLKGSSVISEVKNIRSIGDSAAVVIDESGVLMADEETVPSSRLVRATWLLAKHDGRWLIEAYHNSPIRG